jgi:ribosomal protein L11 methyltransferase
MSRRDKKRWLAADVTARPDAVEAVEYAFNTLDSLGTEISDLRRDTASDMCVTGYFDEPPDEAALKGALDNALQIYAMPTESIISIDTHFVEETDWLAEWKKHWKPSVVGEFIIAPPWSDVNVADKIVVRIEPNMAFGTGTHETTQLCLNAISDDLREGMSFLDIGTGTGILAIAAAKLLPLSRITACDTDPEAVKIARENAAANDVADRIEFFEGSLTDDTAAHEFVCANLTLDVITPLLPTLIGKAQEILFLSGILAEQHGAIKAELLKFQISNFKFEYSGEWLSVLVRN